jgi:hypothetical protein
LVVAVLRVGRGLVPECEQFVVRKMTYAHVALPTKASTSMIDLVGVRIPSYYRKLDAKAFASSPCLRAIGY